jgi:hypothetical protein
MPIFKCDGSIHSKQFIDFITSLIIVVQCWRRNVAGHQTDSVGEVFQRSPVNQQGRLQHN